ncbi:MAG: phospho-N-acetylmuramoyl-pentapeptide-transferase [Nitrospiraceae bacterium]|nr:phospho-N-acetylmuramoyl-pentapeptide-transferase [Nitrospiraceae bacterium]
MLYYLSQLLTPYFGAFNVFRYHTVRAGAAAFTGFFFCLVVGPVIIRALRALKVGQVIKKDHVADLHELHKGKAGTPTMGGALIIVSTLFALLLWSNLSNRLLLIVTAVFCMLGAVGFVDDFIKLRRKHNDGLSARAKIIGQVATGLLLGLALYFFPVTVGSYYVSGDEVLDWPGIVNEFKMHAVAEAPSPVRRIWDRLSPTLQRRLLLAPQDKSPNKRSRDLLLGELNAMLEERDLYDAELWHNAQLNGESQKLLDAGLETLSKREMTRFNRLLLEAVLPTQIARGTRNLHTSVEVPGFKDLLIPLGPLYILLVIAIIVGTSNAVNLTDGLDGLAVGISVVSLLAYTGIAYVVSRVDWSEYLYLIYVPEASELTVFGAAVLGTGLGFLWFNAHPAEVFMGDTGSLALGGVIGTMAILTKQELLLPLVAGVFVLEALSVMIQVASFKLTGKRVFRMAPLHHHFELSGWSETKVTVRFWIVAILFALLSMGTLKLR